MPTTDIDVYVSRPTGGPVNLNDGVDYKIVEITPGARVMENTIEVSPFSNGGLLVASRVPMLETKMLVRCYGDTPADALSKFDVLVSAMQQFTYTITIEIGTRTEVLTCMPADLDPKWDPNLMRIGWLDVSITVPRQP